MSIAKEGILYILFLAVCCVIAFAVGFFLLGSVFFILAVFLNYFFRDPERSFSGDAGSVLSPADGKIVSIREEEGKPVLSIFLSVFNVHVNRAPVAGQISRIEYKKGKFLAAFDERASVENEQNSITIDRDGTSVRFVQIAGLIARRIVCWKREGERLAAGERIGLIKFGSRVDVFFPAGSKITIQMGCKVKAGETAIGVLP